MSKIVDLLQNDEIIITRLVEFIKNSKEGLDILGTY